MTILVIMQSSSICVCGTTERNMHMTKALQLKQAKHKPFLELKHTLRIKVDADYIWVFIACCTDLRPVMQWLASQFTSSAHWTHCRGHHTVHLTHEQLCVFFLAFMSLIMTVLSAMWWFFRLLTESHCERNNEDGDTNRNTNSYQDHLLDGGPWGGRTRRAQR